MPTNPALFELYNTGDPCELRPHVLLRSNDDDWPLRRFKLEVDGEVVASAISANGRSAACVSGRGVLQVYDLATAVPVAKSVEFEMCGKQYEVATALSPDGSKVAVSHPGFIEVREVGNETILFHDTSFPTDEVMIPIVFSSKDSLVACRSNRNNIEVRTYELEGNRFTDPAGSADGKVRHVALSPNGLYAGCVSNARKVTVWDLSTNAVIAQFDVPGNKDVMALAISPGGNYVAVGYGGEEKRVAMWSREKKAVIWDERCFGVGDIIMPFSADCTTFATRYDIWDMET